MSETLISKTPKTEFEKLIWERHMNAEMLKELTLIREEKGKLESEISHVKYKMKEMQEMMKKDNVGALVVKNKKLKDMNDKKDVKIRGYKKDNDTLMKGLIRLQQEKRGLLKGNVEECAG